MKFLFKFIYLLSFTLISLNGTGQCNNNTETNQEKNIVKQKTTTGTDIKTGKIDHIRVSNYDKSGKGDWVYICQLYRKINSNRH